MAGSIRQESSVSTMGLGHQEWPGCRRWQAHQGWHGHQRWLARFRVMWMTTEGKPSDLGAVDGNERMEELEVKHVALEEKLLQLERLLNKEMKVERQTVVLKLLEKSCAILEEKLENVANQTKHDDPNKN
eukprot:TRINITY_DN118108_c0_g1_i1.p1 TRINITY_DN118108_c0_g1~~TRINITY_DN118108_c0_g1_i1.p1  ORF type:complete len:130 (-),score=11.80 TRINITY_DN118108_c0_g1_i1:108-497(-)